ncbi:MAG: MBL fold metallo-hydrolase [Candidatus Nanopelagicales bacterium]
MLVASFPASFAGTNCYVVAPGTATECIVIDPGVEVVSTLDEVIAEHRLRPVAVLLTHGHLDHTFSVAPVCGARDIPAWIHPDDRDLLADPLKGLSRDAAQLFGGRFTFTEPDDVRPLLDGALLSIAGLEISVDHAPGHTPGSVMFRLPGAADDNPETMFSGDVLFAGSIGRTDLPGGSYERMLHSLATKCLPLDDDVVVLPGHGGATTIGAERASNPFLAQAAPLAGPSRGL